MRIATIFRPLGRNLGYAFIPLIKSSLISQRE